MMGNKAAFENDTLEESTYRNVGKCSYFVKLYTCLYIRREERLTGNMSERLKSNLVEKNVTYIYMCRK